MFFMDEGGSFLHRLLRIKYRRKDFVFDPDEMDGLLSDVRIDRGHSGNLIAVGPDLIGFERGVILVNPEFNGRDVVAR